MASSSARARDVDRHDKDVVQVSGQTRMTHETALGQQGSIEEKTAELNRLLRTFQLENAKLRRQLKTSQLESVELKRQLRKSQQESAELRTNLRALHDQSKLLKEKTCSGETEGASLMVPTGQGKGFTASLRANCPPVQVRGGQPVTCWTGVQDKVRGRYEASTGTYTVPVSGRYNICLSHTHNLRRIGEVT